MRKWDDLEYDLKFWAVAGVVLTTVTIVNIVEALIG